MSKVQGIEINRRVAEFQVIISIDFDDGRLYPLTESLPECLLPICNERLLFFQLYHLEKCGATEVLIVTPDDYKAALASALVEFSSETMFVELVAVEDGEFQGSADSLRHVSDRIRGEFIFMSSDILCQFDIAELVNSYRIKATDVTLALYAVPIEEPDKKGGKPKLKIEDQDQEYIGITDKGRVMMKLASLEVEEYLSITKPLLHREKFKLRTDLIDSGMYVFSRWVIDLLLVNPKISNIKTDLIPFLITRQFQTKSYFEENMPSIFQRNRNLQMLDKWLVYQDLKIKQLEILSNCDNTIDHRRYKELSDFVLEELNSNSLYNENNQTKLGRQDSFEITSEAAALDKRTSTRSNISSATHHSQHSTVTATHEPMSVTSTTGNNSTAVNPYGSTMTDDEILGNSAIMTATDNEYDLLRCYAYVCEYSPNYTLGLLQRMTTISSYLSMNKDIPLQSGPFSTQVKGYQKKENSALSEGLELGEKVVYKQTSIGRKCSIGAKSKLNNCVVMDNVKIGEGCTIQNSVICSQAVIENNCSLNDVRVGYSATVSSGSKIKDEDITA